MTFRRFTRFINHHLHKRNTHQQQYAFTNHQHLRYSTSPFKKSFKSTYSNPFKTPYSSRLNPLFSQCFNIIHHHIHRQNHFSSLFIKNNHKCHRNLLHNKNLFFKRFASMDVSKDYYKVLGVKQTATKKEIRSSYLKLAKTWHPDLHKEEKDKKNARNKFIAIQEAYEVLHDDAMRKKYDEMRRIGISQDQYKYQEAYQRQYGQRPRSSSSGNPFEDQFRRNMQFEWEKIRREQQEWASARRAERHQYSDQFPFGNMGNQNPFGFGGNDSHYGGQGPVQMNPFEGFFRTFMYIFAFFMAFRLIGVLLFGPPRDRRRERMGSGYDPFGPGDVQKQDRYSDRYYGPSEYRNRSLPPPLSLREKDNEARERRERRKLDRGPYRPPIPPIEKSPKPKNSLKDDRRRRGMDAMDAIDSMDDENISFSGSKYDGLRRTKNRRKTKYEKMLEEQRLMEEVYIRARRKQMEEQEYDRQRNLNRRFGRGGDRNPPPKSGMQDEEEDVNKAWERYLNGDRGKNGRWRSN